MHRAKKRALKRHPPPARPMQPPHQLPPPPPRRKTGHSTGQRKRLRMALKKMEAIEHHIEHHISQLDVSLVKHGWFAEDAISAKTELASAGLQGTVYPITSMNCFDCPIGQTLRFIDATTGSLICLVDRSRSSTLSMQEYSALHLVPQHLWQVKRSGRGIPSKEGSHAFMGLMGMYGYRDAYGHTGRYFQLPCGDQCIAGRSGLCQWPVHAKTIVRKVVAHRHQWTCVADYRLRSLLSAPPALSAGDCTPSCAFTVDFWALSHKDSDDLRASGMPST